MTHPQWALNRRPLAPGVSAQATEPLWLAQESPPQPAFKIGLLSWAALIMLPTLKLLPRHSVITFHLFVPSPSSFLLSPLFCHSVACYASPDHWSQATLAQVSTWMGDRQKWASIRIWVTISVRPTCRDRWSWMLRAYLPCRGPGFDSRCVWESCVSSLFHLFLSFFLRTNISPAL